MNKRPSIGIACTDRGQHGWTELGDLSWFHGLLRANQSAVYGVRADRQKTECVWLDHLDPSRPEYRVHMRCGRCTRHVEWTHETAMKVLEGLRHAGEYSLDISALP